jgi:hypothetical protein
MRPIRRKTLDGRNLLPRNARNIGHARPRGFAVNVHGTGTAQPYTAPVLRAAQIQNVADHPQQRRVGGHIHSGGAPVNQKFEGHGLNSAEKQFDPRLVNFSLWLCCADRGLDVHVRRSVFEQFLEQGKVNEFNELELWSVEVMKWSVLEGLE